MKPLEQFIPDIETMMSLAPEDLGLLLLRMVQDEGEKNFTLSDIQLQAKNLVHAQQYRSERAHAVEKALSEAWQWLMNEGLIIVSFDQPNGYFCITRKGASLKNASDVKTYMHGNLLPIPLLHPLLAEKVRPMFLRGDYDVAVFQAFKEVEVLVRSVCKYTDDLVGTKLMRRAFDPETGPLRWEGVVLAEREAIAHLFSGAIGHCKNPQSHRDVRLRRTEAARLIALASYLLEDVEITAFKKTHDAESGTGRPFP